jgi:putative Mg2+ transporter-C (MgtC) family protein
MLPAPTLGGIMFDDVAIVLRLLAAAAAGIVLGFQREVTDKPIGMRTLALVSLGAAMVAATAVRYPGLGGEPDAISRVLQGVLQGLMVGVGFIGAGVILRDESTKKVHGLTTATTVWIAAALGIACGVADWLVAASGLVLALVILIVLKKFENRVTPHPEKH